MPKDREPFPDDFLDARTARLGRDLYAEVRARDAAEQRAIRRQVPSRDGGVDGGDGPLGWLFGSADDAGGDAGGCGD